MLAIPIAGFLACISFALRVDDPVGKAMFTLAAVIFGAALIASVVNSARGGKR